MIRQECIDELAVIAGVGPHVAAITARTMNGELDFEDALIERVALLRGLDSAVFDDVLRDRITYMPGGFELVATMKAQGGYAALVSGGFTAFTTRVAAALGFDENRANNLLVQDGKLTGEVVRPIWGVRQKFRRCKRLPPGWALRRLMCWPWVTGPMIWACSGPLAPVWPCTPNPLSRRNVMCGSTMAICPHCCFSKAMPGRIL